MTPCPHDRRRLLALGALLAMGSVGLAACSGQDGAAAPVAPVAGVTSTPAATSTGPVGAFRQLSVVECTHGSGGWSFSATLTNSDRVRTTFTVSVAIEATGGAALGRTQIVRTLDAGASARLEATHFSTAGTAGAQCVPTATKVPA